MEAIGWLAMGVFLTLLVEEGFGRSQKDRWCELQLHQLPVDLGRKCNQQSWPQRESTVNSHPRLGPD